MEKRITLTEIIVFTITVTCKIKSLNRECY